MSHSVKMPIAIITSPAGATAALPQMQTILSPTSSKSNQTFQYRVEERRRTVFIKSDTPPSQWDAGTVQEIIKLADIQEGEAVHVQEQQQGRLSPPNSSRRTQSMTDKEYLIYEEEASPQQTRSEGEKDVRKSTYLRRPGPKSESALRGSVFMRSDSPSSNSSKRRSRPRILFYHKQDPHYGFTNFSAHPVMYEQKKYPTSEHLFQSFKVRLISFSILRSDLFGLSSKAIDPDLLSISGRAPSDRALPSLKPVDFNQKLDATGCRSTLRW